MSKKDKLLSQLLGCPNTFTWTDMVKVLTHCGFKTLSNSGSRRKFVHEETKKIIIMHEPHPGNEVKSYNIKDAVKALKELGYE